MIVRVYEGTAGYQEIQKDIQASLKNNQESYVAVPSSTEIYADKIILQVFGEQPLAIMVQSKAVSKAYKKYFHALWQSAKPVKY